MLLALAAQAAMAQLGFADGPPVGLTDLGAVASSRFRVKEVVRFEIDKPCEITALSIAFAGPPGAVDVHIWKDIDHEWPFYRFERELTKPIRIQVSAAGAKQWKSIPLRDRKLVVENPGYIYVGTVFRPNGPQLAVDAQLDHPLNSRYEVFDLNNTRSAKAYWVRPPGDYLVRLTTKNLPESPELFREVSKDMGLQGARAACIAWADVDGDGWEDLFVGRSLFRNLQGKRFQDISRASGVASEGPVIGIFADIDNDGDQDLFLGSSGRSPDRIYRNDGKGRFQPTEDLIDNWPTKSATWLDFDLDGRVDLFVANGADGVATRNRLWRNIGHGRFALADVMTINGTKSPVGFHRAVTAADLDLDGRAEVALATLRLQPDQLWWFTKSAAQDKARMYRFDVARSPAGKVTGGQGAGVSVGDLDGDARPDIWVANLMHPDWRGYEASVLSAFFMSGGGKGLKRRDADWMGLEFDESPADPTLGDFDNDGDLDAYVGSTYHRGDYYENVGGRFKNATHRSGIETLRGEASAACDFDHDGRLDLALITNKNELRLYRNVAPKGNWLEVELHSKGNVIGASLLLRMEHGHYLRQVVAGKGLGSQDSSTLHFGLGRAKVIEELRVLWPGGTWQAVAVPKVDRRLAVRR